MRGIENFIRFLKVLPKKRGYVSLYRGQSKTGYDLKPSLFRNLFTMRKESHIFRTLIASHPQEFESDATTLEQLARMQHYRLPTRMLDVTWNPLNALYFSAEEEKYIDEDGEVLIFHVKESQVKFFDSDTVSCLANIAYLSPRERNVIRRQIRSAITKDEFNGINEVSRLIQFIRAEKPHFRSEIVAEDLKKVVFVRPKHSNRRIFAQNGAFLLFGLIDVLREQNDFGIEIQRITVPAKSKIALLRDLDLVGCNKGSMFPEMENSADYITKKLKEIIPVT